ncbi:MAG: amidohydrolase family protein [Desulfurococcaceae archaeon]
MKVVDTHMHFGPCRIFGLRVTEQDIIDYLNRYNVVAAIVQPFPGSPDPISTHNEIYNLSQKFKGRIFGLASINPFLDEELVRRELERTLGELGFVGVKLHTAGHAISPTNPRADMLFEIAGKYKVPVMIHTGPGPFSDPMLVASKAEEYPDVKIILAHAGFGIYANGALFMAKKYDNVYLELSWSHVFDVAAFTSVVPDKVLFGTDLVENIPVEYAKLEGLRLQEDIKEKLLYLNAKKVFNLPV